MTIRKMGQAWAVAVVVMAGWSHSAALIEWDFNAMVSNSSVPTQTIKTPGVNTTGLRRGAGMSSLGLSRFEGAWGGTLRDSTPYVPPLTRIIADNQDAAFLFDITVGPDFSLSLESIQTPWCGWYDPSGPGGTGGTLYGQWQYSLDNGATAWNDIGGSTGLLPFDRWDWVELDLTEQSALQDISNVTVTFRLLLWGGDHNTQFYFGKDTVLPVPGLTDNFPNTLIIYGTLIPIPEPSAITLIALSGVALLLRRRYKPRLG